MKDKNNEFRYACKDYLQTLSLGDLRIYGRDIGVAQPTTKKKGELIELIVAILTGENSPIGKSNRGAPVKDSFIDPKIPKYIERLQQLYIGGIDQSADDTSDYLARLQEMREKGEFVLTVEDPNAEEIRKNGVRQIYKGQLQTLGGVSMLLPLTCIDSEDKIVISVEMIRAYDLREGDVITCYAEKRSSFFVVTTVLTVNDLVVDTFRRGHFDDYGVCFPHKMIHTYEEGRYSGLANKYLEWLLPMGRGQRGLIVAPPKSGATALLLEVCQAAAKLNGSMRVLTLLVDQSPETVSQFRKVIEEGNLLYTTYEDESERQIFVADYLLKRVKRYAESGSDVLLIVDSFNALARAFNDTDASEGGRTLAGGMESKTVQYIKRYFGSARCFEKGGSLTVLGALSVDTGNPADDLLRAELSGIASYELSLSEDFARRRIYPAIDVASSSVKKNAMYAGIRQDNLDYAIRNEFLPRFSGEALAELLAKAKSFECLEDMIFSSLKKK